MAKDVYANGNAIAGQVGGGKVVAAFPDVCNSPPPPPTGPIPVPYPCSSFSKDLKKGSKQVKIAGKPAALKDQSYYKSSPLGDEASTRSFGASLLSHTNGGKTFFAAHSMDVKFEGKGVARHIDIATSNHASYPGSTPPFPNMESMTLAAIEAIEKDLCACCGEPKHATGAPMGRDDWYNDHLNKKARANGWPKVELRTQKRAYRKLVQDAMARAGCSCATRTEVLPRPPCDVFYGQQPDGSPERINQKAHINDTWDAYRPRFLAQKKVPPWDIMRRQMTKKLGRVPSTQEMRKARKTNHLTPKTAGGCPTGKGNLQLDAELCAACQALDDRFTAFQT